MSSVQDVSVPSARDRLIVALDCDGAEALALARSLEGAVRWLKVGMTLFYEQGPQIVARLQEQGFDIFLDLKLHDIPHQVEGAAARAARLGAGMLTVHALGGAEMIDAAVRGAARGADEAGIEPPSILAVTVLTSSDDRTLASLGIQRSAAEQVELLASLVATTGAAGCVCSPNEASVVAAALRPGSLVVTPGVRPAGSHTHDQSRVSTPAAASASGATHLVIGRPITAAPEPREAAWSILEEMESL